MKSLEWITFTIITTINEEIGGFDKIEIGSETSLADDLKIETDDFSFLLVPSFNQRIGAKLSNEKWLQTNTVGEIAAAYFEQLSSEKE